MKVKLLSKEGGEGTAAVVEFVGREFECMDCFGYGRGTSPEVGDTFEAKFSDLYATDHSGRAAITENYGNDKKLLSLGGWRYQAYGEVLAVDPWTIVDCGVVVLSLSRAITDPSLVGRSISVEIERLDGWREFAPIG